MEIYVIRNGEQLGPLSPENVRAQIESGNSSTADYAWTAGLDDGKAFERCLNGAESSSRKKQADRRAFLSTNANFGPEFFYALNPSFALCR
jgi:hypothetical protein